MIDTLMASWTQRNHVMEVVRPSVREAPNVVGLEVSLSVLGNERRRGAARTGASGSGSGGTLGGRALTVRPSALVAVISKERQRVLEELRALAETGAIRPVVDPTFTLEEVPEAVT
jgi:NADPH:quinone reductase-like Zn-dependent oxidoreductase